MRISQIVLQGGYHGVDSGSRDLLIIEFPSSYTIDHNVIRESIGARTDQEQLMKMEEVVQALKMIKKDRKQTGVVCETGDNTRLVCLDLNKPNMHVGVELIKG